MQMMTRTAAACLTAVSMSGNALAHNNDPHERTTAQENYEAVETAFGKTGRQSGVVKTVQLEMNDEMQFKPNTLHIGLGETIRFVVKNNGEVMHELVLGRQADLRHHSELMVKFPLMEHDEPYMTHVSPGKRGKIVWTFSKAGQFEYGCLIPGHYEAGMKGAIHVAAAYRTSDPKAVPQDTRPPAPERPIVK